MNYGFVIDNTRCIGCHACSTACKSENEVPLGVDRTWVKYVEHGAFPDVTRTFQVTRCNHCENPPCVRICPVTAMYQRDDGIVEFDKDICIGCKACMQACPYDAIHIDPNTHTAAKCHYCAHRIDAGLEPACAVVCPTEAIVAGDLDDPMSKIAKLVATSRVSVRKPEQGTAPKVLYIDGDAVALHPTVFAAKPKQLMFADVVTQQGTASQAAPAPRQTSTAASGAKIRVPAAQGLPAGSPVGGTRAEQMIQLAYNAQHELPWHWPVPAYLVTKGIGAGIFGFLALGWGLGLFAFDQAAIVWGGLLAILATLATTGLLVMDLERPERFLSILLRPQWKSWLTRGAFLLVGFAGISGAWWAGEAAAAWTGGAFVLPTLARAVLGWLTLPLAVGAAIYTAFLFAQAEGRDLWQSPLLPLHLLVQATMMGTGALLGLSAVVELGPDLVAAARVGFGVSLGVDLFVILLGEFAIPHASELAARAAHEIRHGRHARNFWWGAIVLGHLVPLALLLIPAGALPSALAGVVVLLAAATAAIGLYAYEYVFVMAPQELPNS
ncbi:Fe-S-cluster-containing hydrogenase components 1 [Enhygromyxa salina]|uniref:Fe-S-cluster-containing hydrogenase components 1 n=1 Tax=Enhygromyxa salina TaxID=215803 RepID=A0A0C2CTL1_9BACT|nr:4Fe-4S dicluster domain-containing protein [Enhygromyxa salina]KIG14501.1 Fe-S-cluster-containing hydrogenase components 1 [Enhygromyxa salina]